MRIVHITDAAPGAPAGRDTHLRVFAARSGAMGHENRIVTGDDYLAGRMEPFSKGQGVDAQDVTILHGRGAWGSAGSFTGRGVTLAWAHDQSFVCPASISWFRNSRVACFLPLGAWCVSNGYVQHCNARNPVHNLRNVRAVAKTRANVGHLDGIIVASQYMKARLVAGGVDSQAIHVLPYFVRVPEVRPGSVEERPSRILYFGRLNDMKGVDVLVDAFALLPTHCELHIAGEGATLPMLRERVRSLGLSPDRVTFEGYTPDPARVDEIYAGAAVVAMPSLWPEPFGIVGLEALARGKPIVASNVGGIPDWMRDGEFGHLVEPDNPKDLASRLFELIDSPERRRRFGTQGRDFVRDRFSWERHWSGFERILSEVQKASQS